MSRVLIDAAEALECPNRLRVVVWHIGYRCDERGLFYEHPSKMAARLGLKLDTLRRKFREIEAQGLIEEFGRHPLNPSLRVWRVRFGNLPEAEEVSVMEPKFEPRETSGERRRRVAEKSHATNEISRQKRRISRDSNEEPKQYEGVDDERAREAKGQEIPQTHSVPATLLAPPAPTLTATAADSCWVEVRRLYPNRAEAASKAQWLAAVMEAGNGERILAGLRRNLLTLQKRPKVKLLRYWLADGDWLLGEGTTEAKEEARGEGAIEESSKAPTRTPSGKVLSDEDQQRFKAFEKLVDETFKGDVEEAWRQHCSAYSGGHKRDLLAVINARWPQTGKDYYRKQRLAAEQATIRDLKPRRHPDVLPC